MVPTQQTPRPNGSAHDANSTALFAKSTSDLSLADLYLSWYVYEQHSKPITGEGQQRSQQQANFKKFARTICYMNLFLPVGTVITSVPTDRAGDAYDVYVRQIRNFGLQLEDKVVEFRKKYPLHVSEAVTNVRQVTTACRASHDHLQKVPREHFPNYTVLDYATSNEYLFKNIRAAKQFGYKE